MYIKSRLALTQNEGWLLFFECQCVLFLDAIKELKDKVDLYALF